MKTQSHDEARRLLQVRADLRRREQRTRPDPDRRRKSRPLVVGDGRGFEPDLVEAPSSDLVDRQERSAERLRGKYRMKFAFWDLIGPTPECDPGDTHVAAAFHRRILHALDQGGWTKVERTKLGQMEKTWRARASGDDVRFVLAGNRAGRLPRDLEAKIARLKSPHT